jgi:hypothetical protein
MTYDEVEKTINILRNKGMLIDINLPIKTLKLIAEAYDIGIESIKKGNDGYIDFGGVIGIKPIKIVNKNDKFGYVEVKIEE